MTIVMNNGKVYVTNLNIVFAPNYTIEFIPADVDKSIALYSVVTLHISEVKRIEP